ncbi:zinc ribbon domain-containing protein [Clostridium grantii]|uniref:Zinc-ribbon domain-containing protein n=1 Tax=Clostridium grantii DSM 8605 TaxID=1121316 RepID=A0A1M5Y1T6_9CLOT|nr:zinc ribbon domain-containing protein [Clostridium grantii]SHI05758.1 zinc-ribbon domain-containing protein [Clostridium grantii DSM 8605]
MLCNKCGNNNPEDSSFCIKCGTSIGTTENQETRDEKQVSGNTPKWAQERLKQILKPNETVMLEVKGRVEVTIPNGLGALIWWISYIMINLLGIIYGLIVRKTAWMVLTNDRLIILTEEGVNFPFWVIKFSRKTRDYIIYKEKLASINAIKDKNLWFITSKGFFIESIGSLGIIFNGMKETEFQKAKQYLFEIKE